MTDRVHPTDAQTGQTVLIVDDTLANLRLLTEMLRDRGYKVRGAPNGDIALNAIRSAPPDVILLDINMPGKNGYDVCRELKNDDATRHIPVIFLSALDEAPDKVTAFQVGGADYVSKPFQIEEVLARVEHQLQLQRLQRELGQARLEAESASQAKSIFLADMSHEIRTPMNAILGFAQILAEDPGLTASQRKAVSTIATSGEHLLALINDILDLSKIEAGREDLNVDDFDLADLLRELGPLFEFRCLQKGLNWRIETPDGEPRRRGDEGKLRQVLINLLGNAVKFTERGSVGLRVTRSDDDFTFVVSDTGAGIEPERQKQIFEPFQQDEAGLKQGGTGLGLAIAHRHVALMQGRLELDSSPGAGSRFSVTVPLPPASAAPATKTVVWDRPCRLRPGSEVRALLVDDIDTDRDILSHMLSTLGVEIDIAVCGQQALERVVARRPDIAFLDIAMPDMDGVELLQHLHKQHGADAFRTVAISASALTHQQRACLDAGFDRFIGKPYRREQIYAAIADLLDVTLELLPESGPATDDTPLPDVVAIPGDRLRALREAAEGHNMTQLKQQLEQLDETDAGQCQLAAHLWQLTQNYDFPGLIAALQSAEEI